MKFVVVGGKDQFEYLKGCAPDAEWAMVDNAEAFSDYPDADAFFNLKEGGMPADYKNITQPVFIHSVIATLSERNVPPHVIRINAWKGFLEKDIWEIAGNISQEAESVLKHLKKKYIVVNDIPGFVTARVLAMIINEAFFARGENVSTEKEIDVAMKLGTNYPYGPFEWGNLIGLENIYALLEKLSVNEDRYKVAPALKLQMNLPS